MICTIFSGCRLHIPLWFFRGFYWYGINHGRSDVRQGFRMNSIMLHSILFCHIYWGIIHA